MSIAKKPFGTLSCGREAALYTMTNASGASVSITDFGGIVTRIVVPDKQGALGDVVLGYDRAEYYEPNYGYLGALIGRVGNRIARGQCVLNGEKLALAANANGHHLHGGRIGFDKKLWSAACEELPDEDRLVLAYVSPDGEENYPGELTVKVTYAFTARNELKIRYEATSDRDTLCNLTNHSYFNLDCEGSGKILGHVLALDADRFTVVDRDCIPTGELRPVDGTPFDLRGGLRICEGLAREATDEQLICGKGYDHNFVLNGEGLRRIGRLTAERSGRFMDIYTDMVGVQFYSGNMIDCVKPGKRGVVYTPRDGLCLETQFHPDSINHPNFPDSVLRAGAKYDHTTIYAFGVV